MMNGLTNAKCLLLLLLLVVLVLGCNEETSRVEGYGSSVNAKHGSDASGSVVRLIEDCVSFYGSGGWVMIEVVRYDRKANRKKIDCSFVGQDELCMLSKMLIFEQQGGDVATLESKIILYSKDSVLAVYGLSLSLAPMRSGAQNADTGWMAFLDVEGFIALLLDNGCLCQDPRGLL